MDFLSLPKGRSGGRNNGEGLFTLKPYLQKPMERSKPYRQSSNSYSSRSKYGTYDRYDKHDRYKDYSDKE